MAINGSELMRALKARYKTPRDVLARLGLDQNLLRAGDEELRQGGETLLRHGMPIADIQKLIDDHVSKSDVRVGAGGDNGLENLHGEAITEREGSFDSDPPIRRPNLVQNEGGSDDEPDDVETSLRNYLKKAGWNEDQIQGAIDAGYHRGGRDALPLNAVRSSERPAPSRGHFGGERGDRFADGNARPAMDEAAKVRLHQMFPDLARIEREPEVRQSYQVRDRRSALDAAPGMQTAKQRERLNAMFPNLKNIGAA